MEALQRMKQRQKHYYDRQAKTLEPIAPGDIVRMRLPGQKTWSAGTCLESAGPRSYEIQVGERQYRRNRRHLIPTPEVLPSERDLGAEDSDKTTSTVPADNSPAESKDVTPTFSPINTNYKAS